VGEVMKENKFLYISILLMFLALLTFQFIHFVQIDSIYVSAFDYRSFWYIPYTLFLLASTITLIYLLPILFVIRVHLLFISFKKTYRFDFIRKDCKKTFKSFIQIESVFSKLQVIRC